MNLYILKIKRIVPLSVSLLWAATICYALLKWLFISQDIGLIKKEAWDIFIPLFLSLAIAFGVLGRRTRILPERHSSAVKYVLWITGTALLSLAQVYVSNKLAVTTHLHAIRGEEPVPLGRYYELDSIGLDLSAMSCYTDSRVMSRRGGSKLVFHAYVATRFSNQRKVWYVKHFQKKIKYTFATEEEVQIVYLDFVDHYTSELSQYDFGAQHRFERVAASDERDGYLSAVERALGGVAIDLARLGRFNLVCRHHFGREPYGAYRGPGNWCFTGSGSL